MDRASNPLKKRTVGGTGSQEAGYPLARRAPLGLVLVLACALSMTSDSVVGQSPDLSTQKKEQGLRLLQQFREEVDPERRLKVVADLAQLGPEAVIALKRTIESIIDAAPTEPPETNSGKRIDQLRQALAKLRQNENLTKEMLEDDGLPVLTELNAIYPKYLAESAPGWRKLQAAKTDLVELASFLDHLEAETSAARISLPVPLDCEGLRLRAQTRLDLVPTSPDELTKQLEEENSRQTDRLDPAETKAIATLNRMRPLLGLPGLKIDRALCNAARDHARDMATRGFFSHQSPVPGKAAFTDRARRAGTTASAENIYMGKDQPSAALKAWFASPGHHKIMFGDSHARIGIGRHETHWVLMMGR